MLRLNSDQLTALEAIQSDQFTEELVAYMQDQDPFHAAALGAEGVRSVVILGRQKAESYGVSEGSSVRTFVHMMFILGSHFDADPLLPWARETLLEPADFETQSGRMRALRTGMLEFFDRVVGDQGENLKEFMHSIHAADGANELPGTLDEITEFVQHNYASRSQDLGEGLLRRLIDDSAKVAEHAALYSLRSVFILTSLRLSYGFSVMTDPLHPWVTQFFDETRRSKDPDEAFYRLSQKFLSRVVAYVASKEA